MSSSKLKQQVKRDNIIRDATIAEIKDALIKLYKKEQYFISIKISRNISKSSDFNQMINRPGDTLQLKRKYVHFGSDGVYKAAELQGISKLKPILVEAYNQFCEDQQLV
jgi:hypothetical protein